MTLAWMHRGEIEPGSQPKPTSKFTQNALTACPVIFLGFVAMYSRAYNDEHVVPSGTLAQDAQDYAYAPFVKQTRSVFESHQNTIDRRALLRLAKSWDEAISADKVQPLLQVSFEDSPEDGVRGEVFKAKSLVFAGLLDDATTLAKEGRMNEAVGESLMAIRLTESLKYSDLHTVFVSSTEERRAIALLRRFSPNMSETTKDKVRAGLSSISTDKQDLEALTRESRIQYYDWMARMSKQPISIEDVHRAEYVTKRVVSDPTSTNTLEFIRSTIMSSPSDDGPEYLSELRVAWASENSNESLIKKTLNEI